MTLHNTQQQEHPSKSIDNDHHSSTALDVRYVVVSDAVEGKQRFTTKNKGDALQLGQEVLENTGRVVITKVIAGDNA